MLLGQRAINPMPSVSNDSEHVTQPTDIKQLTARGELSDNSENQNLVSGLFFEEDLQAVVEAWPELSVELRQAIVKMVK